MDYLKGTYKKALDYQVKEGIVVSWHIFTVNNRREGEPDLILTVETRDYQKKRRAASDPERRSRNSLATDSHKADTASGERKKMRTLARQLAAPGAGIQVGFE